jgi:hypothetical protein
MLSSPAKNHRAILSRLKRDRKRAALFGTFAAVVLVGGAVFGSGHLATPRQGTVDFNRDVRPILNTSCMGCHGGVKEAGNVSFSYREQALGKGKSGRPTIVPGNPGASEFMARITSSDPAIRMPLHGPPLPAEQVAVLRRWIKEGAAWQDYWAFVPPKPQPLPAVHNAEWGRRPLDRFILARLEKEGLSPSAQADKAALLRRASLDITGLPPSTAEMNAFMRDTSAGAYERQIDRLLASPAFGERWATVWLDLARYGDTKGFEKDRNRPGAWVYRDWVIKALNSNMPYDQFVVRQLAGDLLPNATLEDRIATSFHRQTLANDEGGTDDEEFRIAAAMDRAATTWTALNGVSFNCVQCHSHPYDPIKHVEYFRFLAFFNTSRDADIGRGKPLPEDWPLVRVPLDKALHVAAARDDEISRSLRASVVGAGRSLAQESRWTSLPIESGKVNEMLAIERALDGLQGPAVQGQADELRQRLLIARTQAPKAAFKIVDGEAQRTGTVPSNSVYEFKARLGLQTLTALRFDVSPVTPETARHSPEDGFVVNRIDAWLMLPDGKAEKIEFRYVAPDAVDSLEANIGRALRSPSIAKGARPVSMDRLAQSSGFMAYPSLFRARWGVAVPVRPVRAPPGAWLRVQFTHTETVNVEPGAPARVRVAGTADPRWTNFANAEGLEANIRRLQELELRAHSIPSVPVPVMAEQDTFERRPTLLFDRGSFLTKVGADLQPNTPSVFPAFPSQAPQNRLTMARWFFEPTQPLTARVAVNRVWEQLFGTGIVETLEDFGSAGEVPSHPELLDWLALHYSQGLRWDTKALIREIVTSATYRQSAAVSPSLRDKDPNNRLLARGPRQRLTAEMVRDQALFSSGLLNPAIGGPPVMPPQPPGVWNSDVSNLERWTDATGPDRFRRAIYTYIKRTSVYPSLVAFDAADRQLSLPRRIPTNTPLQALVTLNDPVYREAAQALARRMNAEGVLRGLGTDAIERQINYGATRVLSRNLTTPEMGALKVLYERSSNAALGGDRRTVALTEVASALFNLDAALMR